MDYYLFVFIQSSITNKYPNIVFQSGTMFASNEQRTKFSRVIRFVRDAHHAIASSKDFHSKIQNRPYLRTQKRALSTKHDDMTPCANKQTQIYHTRTARSLHIDPRMVPRDQVRRTSVRYIPIEFAMAQISQMR